MLEKEKKTDRFETELEMMSNEELDRVAGGGIFEDDDRKEAVAGEVGMGYTVKGYAVTTCPKGCRYIILTNRCKCEE